MITKFFLFLLLNERLHARIKWNWEKKEIVSRIFRTILLPLYSFFSNSSKSWKFVQSNDTNTLSFRKTQMTPRTIKPRTRWHWRQETSLIRFVIIVPCEDSKTWTDINYKVRDIFSKDLCKIVRKFHLPQTNNQCAHWCNVDFHLSGCCTPANLCCSDDT